MKPVKILLLTVVVLTLIGTQNIFALTITNQPPTFSSTGNPALATAFNLAILDSWNSIIAEVTDEFADIDDNPQKLGSAFATAGTFSNHAATQRAYQGYDLFAVTVGTMFGGITPYSLANVADGLENDASDTVTTNGDIGIGFGWQAWAAQVGINSKFLLDNLYLGFKFGAVKFKMPADNHEAKVDFLTLGVVANYQVFKERSLFGMLVWRGLSVGSGFLYQKNKTGIIYHMDQQTYTSTATYDPGTGPTTLEIIASPSASFLLDSHLITIPVEVTTSVRLFWVVNLSVGLGADINFGKSSMLINIHADADVPTPPADLVQENTGYIDTTAGVKNAKPKAFTTKAMFNLGFGIGPIMIDIPFTYYFNNGFNLGLSVGFIW